MTLLKGINKFKNLLNLCPKNSPENVEDTETAEDKTLLRYKKILCIKERLRKSVFNYCKYQYNEDLKTNNYILNHDAFELERIVNQGLEFSNNRKITLITGPTQSGKTFTMLNIVAIMLSLYKVPVFIVKDKKQKKQLEVRMKKFFKIIKIHLKKEGFTDRYINIFSDPIYIDSTNRNEIPLKECLDFEKGKIGPIICIHHYNHLKRINEILAKIQEKSRSELVLIIDEAHKLGGYKILGDDGITHKKDVLYEEHLYKLKKIAKKIFLNTATPQDILMSEPNLRAHGVVMLPENKKYIGLKDCKFETFKDSAKDSNLIPVSLINILDNLSREEPIIRKNKFGVSDRHPINVLAKFECRNDSQLDILKLLNSKIHREEEECIEDEYDFKLNNIRNSNWAVMTFNQDGVRLCHNSLKSNTFRKGKYEGYGVYLFPNAQIYNVWQWLADSGGIDRFPRVLTISYRSAEEGITFGSKYTDNSNTDKNWHITHEYMKIGDKVRSSSLEQSVGRITGNHGDTIIPVIYCTEDNKKKLLMSYEVHWDITKKICEIARENGDVRVIDFVRKEAIFSNRFCKAYYAIKDAKRLQQVKENPNAFIEHYAMINCKLASHIMEVLEPENYGSRRIEKLEKKMGTVLEDEVECACLEDRFKKWKNDNTIVAKFFQGTVDPDRKYTNEEFKKLCKQYKITQPGHLFTETYFSKDGTISKSKAYGKIFKRNGDFVYMYPEVAILFKKVFNLA